MRKNTRRVAIKYKQNAEMKMQMIFCRNVERMQNKTQKTKTKDNKKKTKNE